MTSIPDHPNYTITREGVVRNVNTGRMLQGAINHKGYWRIGICNKNGLKDYQVAHLLLLTFVRPPVGDETADHIDRDNQNNNLSNLRWLSKSDQDFNRGNYGAFHKHISHTFPKQGNPCWTILIRHPNFKSKKSFSKNKYTYEEVKTHRDEIYRQNNIVAVD